AGFTTQQANGAAEALADALSGADLATKGDVVSLKAEVKSDIAALRTELKADDAALRAQMSREFAIMRRDMEVLRRDLTIKLGGMIFLAVDIILTAFRYMPPHP
ncbi:MAG: hypothetical protein JO227_10755, partial [Acetobacteraceae bacterium]|nr:hypothetical protein [Acetobacteraceae bacterium]